MASLRQYYGMPEKKGSIGVEIEVEAVNALPQVLPADCSWVYHRDGSLRGEGAEYVTRLPFEMAKATKKIDEITKLLADPKLKINVASPRTSVHVHINCQKLTPTQIWTAIFYSWMVEYRLFDLCKPWRYGNQYCLGVRQAEAQVEFAKRDLTQNSLFSFFTADSSKYSGIALHHLKDFGTIEFRMKECMITTPEIYEWVSLLHSIVYGSVSTWKNPEEMLNFYISNGAEAFLKATFPPGFLVRNSVTSRDTHELDSMAMFLFPIIDNIEWSELDSILETKFGLNFSGNKGNNPFVAHPILNEIL